MAMAAPRRRPTSLRLRHNNQPLHRLSFDSMGLHDLVYSTGGAGRIPRAFRKSKPIPPTVKWWRTRIGLRSIPLCIDARRLPAPVGNACCVAPGVSETAACVGKATLASIAGKAARSSRRSIGRRRRRTRQKAQELIKHARPRRSRCIRSALFSIGLTAKSGMARCLRQNLRKHPRMS